MKKGLRRFFKVFLGVTLAIVIIGCIFYYEKGERSDRNLRNDEVLSTLDFRFSGKVYKIEELWSHSFLVTLKDVESEKNYDGRKLFKEYVAVIDNDFAEIIMEGKDLKRADELFFDPKCKCISIKRFNRIHNKRIYLSISSSFHEEIYNKARRLSKIKL
jgi:hypothetical protein